ncbi:SusC/RagA family TonB-linked outer membrane protein [Parabacteroides sp. BX2]|uniref:SusC/RagA family TonB-linked outer membrane protein n=1 Tax=Parabacteroides segnis TaxID=2763058 RepID=A0ABR7DZC4_9BACT|nr:MULTISPECIES: SusC/RagA family TonB-linked outer membrane protein [Parabacteroides]MBC5642871.1 SusC/RagA family TonB-linked outer membrane protein [Parabacteroides segnis]MCM0713022.1 SusC/RagA family TonB-linked outer membrane protein [Parabacteroides sp. TA-V-105]
MNKKSETISSFRKKGNIMKKAGVICISAFLSTSVFAQITLDVKQQTIKQTLRTIEKATDYRFFYSNQLPDLNKTVSFEVNNQSIDATMNKLLNGTGLFYEKREDNQIYLAAKNARGEEKIIKISGTILDNNNEPIIGANVSIKGTTTGTITDIDGNFSLDVSTGMTLLVSYIGYATKEVPVGNQSVYKIIMTEDTQNLDEVVVVGYGTMKKSTVTGAISTMKADVIESIPVSNLSNALAGRLAGVNVTQSTGTPGISSKIRIRASGSWNSQDPIFVIDGVVRSKAAFDALDQSEVNEISMLKDAASTAIYGSRGGDGVVLVTTKQGRKGKPTLQYSGSVTIEHPTKILEFNDAVTHMNLTNFVFSDPSSSNHFSEDEYAYFAKTGAYSWYDEAYETPINTRHAVNVTGGNDRVDYYIGGAFFYQKGFLPNVDYKKYNLRANINAKITKDLTASLSLSNTYGDRHRFNFTYDYESDDLNNLWGKLLNMNWNIPPYIDGKPVYAGWIAHPIERMRNGGYWKRSNQMVDALISLEYKIPFVEGLSVKGIFSKNFNNQYTKSFDKKHTLYGFEIEGGNNHIMSNRPDGSVILSGDPDRENLYNAFQRNNDYQLNVQVNYNRTFGEHLVDALLVYEQAEGFMNKFDGRRNDFPIIVKDQWFATSGNSVDSTVDGSESESARVSYVGRINYSYANKYMLTASVRRDGSMFFAPGKRFGWFPAVSAGWDIAKEDFFMNKISNVQQLKLRASYGLAGQDQLIVDGVNVNQWRWLETYTNGSSMYFGDALQKGIAYSGIVNPLVTWEKSQSINVGVDTRFLENFSVSAEYWNKYTYDILGDRIISLPSSFGATMPPENYGKARAQGFDLEIGYNGLAGDFSWYVKGNLGYGVSKVKLKDFAENGQWVDNPNGKYTDYLKGYVAKDIIRTEEDLQKLRDQYGNGTDFGNYRIHGRVPQLGSIDYVDISGPEGKPDGTIDGYDKDVIANHKSNPVNYGFRVGGEWKGLALELFFQGAAG